MSTAHYTKQILAIQSGMALVAFGVVAALSPVLLLFEKDLAGGVLVALAGVALVAIFGMVTVTAVRLWSQRFALRALSLRSDAIRPSDLRTFDRVPGTATTTFTVACSAAALLLYLPAFRPALLDESRTVSLIVLAVTIAGAAAIPHYVLARRATQHLIADAPSRAAAIVLAEDEPALGRKIRRRILLSVAAPVTLVGVGSLLIAHAHLRAFVEESRRTTARVLARAVLDTGPSWGNDPAADEAQKSSKDLGFSATIVEEPGLVAGISPPGPSHRREPDGSLSVSVPLDGARATVRFRAPLDPKVIGPGAGAIVVATLLAVLFAFVLGREMSRDLRRATRRVRSLSNDGPDAPPNAIARGRDIGSHPPPAPKPRGSIDDAPARFDAVQRLEAAIEDLTDRFREFAAAQEKALAAAETGQRVRGLLFASVSHDLKSPLNAILGFADLLTLEDLTSAQRESLDLVRTRGRELLGLIETILDAARVEAGHLKLAPRPIAVTDLLADAAKKTTDLLAGEAGTPRVEPPIGVPAVLGDPTYASRAIAVIVAHAVRSAAADAMASPVHVSARRAGGDAPDSRPRSKSDVIIEVAYRTEDAAAAAGLTSSLETRARGLVLGLSLARSVIELHGGNVSVGASPDGRTVCKITLPSAPEPSESASP